MMIKHNVLMVQNNMKIIISVKIRGETERPNKARKIG